jgi:23S rRNA (cytosine1962-C5)-methyltransferase
MPLALKDLVLKPGRDRAVRLYHPWVFSGAVQKLPKAETGDIIRIVDAEGKALGMGFFDSKSQIVARIFHFGEAVEASHSFWKEKITKALALRKELVATPETNTYRLIHAEGDGMPGVIADVYGGHTVVLQLRTQGSERLAGTLVDILKELGFERAYLKNKQYDGETSAGSIPDGFLFGEGDVAFNTLENGLQFEVNVATGQKTGFFIDQRVNRKLLGEMSAGKKVLNAFAYSGGFSVYALANGASEVHSVDISKDAIALANKNVALNFPEANHTGIAADCFNFLKETEEQYDLICLDPPAFAKSIGAKDRAARGYKELNMKGIKKVKPGGIVFTFSCSQVIDRDLFRKIVFGAAADVHRNVRIIEQLSQPADHPINIYHPEGEYLKGLVLYVE